MLKGKVAVIYGAGGAVGSAVARVFADEGAVVHARTHDDVDALDEPAVTADLAAIGRVDVSVNLIGVDHVQGQPLLDMSADDFVRGVEARLRTHFITARAAGKRMVRQGSGAILMLTAAPDRTAIPMAGSFGVQCAAVESFARALAVEAGPSGVRVNCIRSAGSPDAAGVDEVFAMHAGNAGLSRADFDRAKARGTVLGRLPRLEEVARTAAFLASDHASAITGAITNVTCGELLD
ncbi:SDR family NAD(P)-dependent oxidoreductase [Actinoplanes sp. NPDC049265]|uniref:SDR family NAD(P)-dependent oxidoreductase n=1 Tax=Actinoplanes sp. NPDC049265 TaxID=3363902 RepID=UPI0037142D7C